MQSIEIGSFIRCALVDLGEEYLQKIYKKMTEMSIQKPIWGILCPLFQ